MLSNYRCVVTLLIEPAASKASSFKTSPKVQMHFSFFLSLYCKFFSFVALLYFFFLLNVSLYDHIPGRRRRCVLLHGRHGHVSQLVLPPSAGRSAHSRLGFVGNQQLFCLPRRVSLWKCNRESSSDREHEDDERLFACHVDKVADPVLVLVD